MVEAKKLFTGGGAEGPRRRNGAPSSESSHGFGYGYEVRVVRA